MGESLSTSTNEAGETEAKKVEDAESKKVEGTEAPKEAVAKGNEDPGSKNTEVADAAAANTGTPEAAAANDAAAANTGTPEAAAANDSGGMWSSWAPAAPSVGGWGGSSMFGGSPVEAGAQNAEPGNKAEDAGQPPAQTEQPQSSWGSWGAPSMPTMGAPGMPTLGAPSMPAWGGWGGEDPAVAAAAEAEAQRAAVAEKELSRQSSPGGFASGHAAASLALIIPPSAPVTEQLCPSLPGVIVPEKNKFRMLVPVLSHSNSDDGHALMRFVQTIDGNRMFNLKVTRPMHSNVESTNVSQPQEYIGISLPEEHTREYALCAVGCPTGRPESHVFQLGMKEWGIIKEHAGGGLKGSMAPHSEIDPNISLYPTSSPGISTFTCRKQGNTVEITEGNSPDAVVASASTIMRGTKEFYDVECYPKCDIMLVIVMLISADRLAATARAVSS